MSVKRYTAEVASEHAEGCFVHYEDYARLLVALKEISKGEGAFSRDGLTHCTNCLERCLSIAENAIAEAEGSAS